MKNVVAYFVLAVLTTCAEAKQLDADSLEANEAMAMITEYHLARPSTSPAYQATAIGQMMVEANYFADRLKLPTPHPIQITDIRYPHVSPPWFSLIKEANFPYRPNTIFTTNIFNPNIPREQRAHALRVGVKGVVETTNFVFGFEQGKLTDIVRLREHEVEYFAKDLENLIGKQSLINDAQAHQLATQWLASVDVNVAALEKKYPPEVNHLRVLPKGSTNPIELPFYFVHWGWQYFTNGDENHTVSTEPLVEIKILGTTKELVNLHMRNTTFSQRPLLLITNALELLRMTSPSMKRLAVPLSEKNVTNAIGQP